MFALVYVLGVSFDVADNPRLALWLDNAGDTVLLPRRACRTVDALDVGASPAIASSPRRQLPRL